MARTNPTLLIRWMLAAMVAVMGVLGVANPAAAQEEDQPPADEWYNGCTGVSDSPGGYDFTDACNWHDLCYGGRIAGYDRAGCDSTFHQFMDTICVHAYGAASDCLFYSAAYYTGVGVFGGFFYNPWMGGGGGGGEDPFDMYFMY
jgi:hypothetical protein